MCAGLGPVVLVVSCVVGVVCICCEAVSPLFGRFRGLISPVWGVYAWVCAMGLACGLLALSGTVVLWGEEVVF